MNENTTNISKKLTPWAIIEGVGIALIPFLVFVNYNYEDFYISPALVTGLILYAVCGFGIAITRRKKRNITHLFIKGFFVLISIDLFVIGVTAVRQKKITIVNAAFHNKEAVFAGTVHVLLSVIIIGFLVWITFFRKKG
jgi:hypothetical protein